MRSQCLFPSVLSAIALPALAVLASSCLADVAALPATAADLDAPLRIHFLGTSAGVATSSRFTTSTAVETPDGVLLIDAGEPVTALLARQGLHIREVREVLITHWHDDHMSGLLNVLMGLRGANVRLPIGEEVIPSIVNTRKAFVWPHEPMPKVTITTLRPGETIRLGDLEVDTHANDHLWPNPKREKLTPPENMPSLSFVLRYHGLRVVYSGDIGWDEKKLWPLIEQPTDLLVLEAAHYLPLDRLLARLQGKPIRRLALNHIWVDKLRGTDLQGYFGSKLGIPVAATVDGQWIELAKTAEGSSYRTGLRSELPKAMKPEGP